MGYRVSGVKAVNTTVATASYKRPSGLEREQNGRYIRHCYPSTLVAQCLTPKCPNPVFQTKKRQGRGHGPSCSYLGYGKYHEG